MRPIALPLACLLAAACATFDSPRGPLDGALRARLESAPERPPFERWRARVRIESDELTTEAQGVAIVSTGAPPRLALQLIPALGGKILDLRVGPSASGGLGLRAAWPHADRDLAVRLDDGSATASLELFFAASVLEAAAPVAPARITGARPTSRGSGSAEATGWDVALAPLLPGLTVVATVDGEGRVVERRFRHGRAEWRESPGATARTFVGRDITVHIEDESITPLDDVDEGLFEVDGE